MENQEKLLSNKDLPITYYTTQSEAVIQFTKSSTSNLKLKIQKVERNHSILIIPLFILLKNILKLIDYFNYRLSVAGLIWVLTVSVVELLTRFPATALLLSMYTEDKFMSHYHDDRQFIFYREFKQIKPCFASTTT